MSREIDAFEEAPNMVPGEVEDAEQFDPASGPVQQNGTKAKLSFVLAGLLFAGGWGYANKEDFKDALGIQPAANLSASTYDGTEMMHGCCPDMMAAMVSEQTACPAGSTCPLPTESGCVAAKGMCCEDGRKNAMAAALLKGTQNENAEETKAAISPPEQESERKNGVSQPEGTAETAQTPEQQQEVSPKTKQPKAEQQSKKETSADASKRTADEKAVDKKP